uniref:BD-FAE-like domain-containing protein n=1 Tax=Ciona savignyi TaxID=51511 RepID=H2YJJ0_CIOSA
MSDEHSPSKYTNRLPAHQALEEFLRVLTEKSKLAREKYRVVQNIQYGDSDRQVVDIYYPDKVESETEVVFFFHGGYWQEGNPEMYGLTAIPVAQSGKICVVVGTDLTPHVSFSTILEQCRKAICHFANFFPLTSKITISGHSSGGHLCAMLLSTDWSVFGKDISSYLERTLRKAVLICGIFELQHLKETRENENLKLTTEEAIKNSPISAHNIKTLKENISNFGCELVLVCVENDAPTILQWNDAYLKELKSNNVHVTYKLLNGLDHFNVIQNITDPASALAQIIVQ